MEKEGTDLSGKIKVADIHVNIKNHGISYDFCASELDEGKHNRSKNISWEFIFKCLRYKN